MLPRLELAYVALSSFCGGLILPFLVSLVVLVLFHLQGDLVEKKE